jgi:hypothetical protein
MGSNLDKIKTTITLSLGTKNRLRDLKGSQSYEEFINYLMRQRNKLAHKNENQIEIQEFNRTKGICSFGRFKVLFSYNKPNNSLSHIFDIKIESIRDAGSLISFQEFVNKYSAGKWGYSLKTEYEAYFQLLITIIHKEIDTLFKHNGRFEDYYSWAEEFKNLGLSEKSYQEDVLEKLEDFNREVPLNV